jgi:hypothetical protein
MSTKNKPGRFDCLAKVGPDEPIFILRAQDAEAADLVELWAMRAKRAGCPLDKVNEAMDTADEMRCWPNRKSPD